MTSYSEHPSSLPELSVLVRAADASLHRWVHEHVAIEVRLAALAEELGFWLNTAAQDMDYARTYLSHAPESGQPAEAFLDRWLRVSADCHVLAGPRFLGRDPNKPFAGITASDRPLLAVDRDDIAAVVGEAFVGFSPGYVMVMTADPAGAWPQTRQELRQVVGLLGDLRTQDIPEELSSRPRRDTDFYDRYAQIHAEHIEQDPTHAGHTRAEERQDLQQLADDGRLFDVLVDKEWAGIVAGESDVRRGVRGATVIELILDHQFRGKGYGRHLSSLLARALPLPDDECLMGTIHPDNTASYRSALAAGRVDVGGEIVILL